MINIGDVVAGRYEIREKIGEGGMQIVHRALDRLIELEVAPKTPKPGQLLRHFAKSAVVAAKINNHNVAKTLDYIEDDDSAILVEELIEGDTLGEVVIAPCGYVDPHLGARLFHKLAKGLAASHHAGVVHRDLKPSNIMVTGGLNLDAVKITDFGIATLTEELFDEEIAKGGDLTKSKSGTVKGALPYMAPEMMFRTKGDAIGQEADVWSLGALMFHVLTGKHPFGIGLEAAANVKNGDLEAWPVFMTSNAQFAPLSKSLQDLATSCLAWKKNERPTADNLVRECGDLCYFNDRRMEGSVQNMPARSFGFIAAPGMGKTFFHTASVYGPNRPKAGALAIFCRSEGNPHPRAHPVLIRKA